jgi:hypothetical protein
MPLLNSVGFNLVKDKLITSADGEKTLKVVAVGYGRTGTVRPDCSKSLIAMASWGSLLTFVAMRKRLWSSKIESSIFACTKRAGVR